MSREGVLIMRYLYVAAAGWLGLCGPASAQAEQPFLGQVLIFAGNFCPKGWAPTDGKLLQINQNVALFSILGTTYGGDGQTTFALPNDQPILTKNGAPLTQCIAERGVYPSRD
jgi:microcystin-dependent protein